MSTGWCLTKEKDEEQKEFDWYVSSDSEAVKVYSIFKDSVNHKFLYVDIGNPINQYTGQLF